MKNQDNSALLFSLVLFTIHQFELKLQINESLGLEMVFSVVSSAQEWLNVKWDNFKTEQDNRAAEKLRELEEAEQVSQIYAPDVHLTPT